jgi:hypothetical protein
LSTVRACGLPADALLRRYVGRGYTDCWSVEIDWRVTHAEFVEAFYTTWVFRLERWILAFGVSRPSTDEQARRLAHGEVAAFAAWTVEARATDQLLLCDYLDRTRSWLMASAGETPDHTRLWFGSAVVAAKDARTGAQRLGATYEALLGFHKLYSRILLGAARARLLARRD